MLCRGSGEERLGVSFYTSISEILDSHYFVCAWILFFCTGIVVSGGWGVGRKSSLFVHIFLYLQLLSKSNSLTVPSAAFEIQKILAAIDFFPHSFAD